MKTYKADDKGIKVKAKERFQILLDGYGATGYSWSIKNADKMQLLKDHNVDPDESSFGAGGTEVFELEIGDVGHKELTFELKSPWEDEPTEVKHIKLDVTD